MKVSGDAVLHAPVEQVWAALNDPAVLARSIPGCSSLDADGPGSYRMVVSAGVASIKGTYAGRVRLSDLEPPTSYVLHASGAGAPGTVSADVQVALAPDPDGTRVTYDADAVVGGMVGGVGQRMLAAVARRMAGEFFGAVDDQLAAPAQGEAPTPLPAAGRMPLAYPGLAPDPNAGRTGFLVGILVGAAVALAGVAVGAVLGGRVK